jgi:hypothetical protein
MMYLWFYVKSLNHEVKMEKIIAIIIYQWLNLLLLSYFFIFSLNI